MLMMMMMVMVVMMVMISFVSKTVKSTPIPFPALSANVLESLKLLRRGSNRSMYCIAMILSVFLCNGEDYLCISDSIQSRLV